LSQEFGVFDRERSTVGQMDIEGLKGARLVQQA
jgi:hypothetical protein